MKLKGTQLREMANNEVVLDVENYQNGELSQTEIAKQKRASSSQREST